MIFLLSKQDKQTLLTVCNWCKTNLNKSIQANSIIHLINSGKPNQINLQGINKANLLMLMNWFISKHEQTKITSHAQAKFYTNLNYLYNRFTINRNSFILNNWVRNSLHQNKQLTDKDFYLPINQYLSKQSDCIQSIKMVADQVMKLQGSQHNYKVINYLDGLSNRHLSNLDILLLHKLDDKKLKDPHDLPYQPIRLIGHKDVKYLTRLISRLIKNHDVSKNPSTPKINFRYSFKTYQDIIRSYQWYAKHIDPKTDVNSVNKILLGAKKIRINGKNIRILPLPKAKLEHLMHVIDNYLNHNQEYKALDPNSLTARNVTDIHQHLKSVLSYYVNNELNVNTSSRILINTMQNKLHNYEPPYSKDYYKLLNEKIVLPLEFCPVKIKSVGSVIDRIDYDDLDRGFVTEENEDLHDYYDQLNKKHISPSDAMIIYVGHLSSDEREDNSQYDDPEKPIRLVNKSDVEYLLKIINSIAKHQDNFGQLSKEFFDHNLKNQHDGLDNMIKG